MIWKKVLTGLGLYVGLLAPGEIKSQHWPREGHFFKVGLGSGWQIVHDQSLSPLNYQGLRTGLSLGYRWQSKLWQINFQLSGSAGLLRPQTPPQDRQATLINGSSTFGLHYRLFRLDSSLLWLGLANRNRWDSRLHSRYGNSRHNFNGLFSYGLSLHLQHPWELRLGNFSLALGLESRLFLPVASTLLLPGYSTPYVGQEPGTSETRWLGRFFHSQWSSSLVWFLKHGDELRLSYSWEIADVNKPNELILGDHYFALEIMTRL